MFGNIFFFKFYKKIFNEDVYNPLKYVYSVYVSIKIFKVQKGKVVIQIQFNVP